ncbi:MAG: 3D domain-containing protein [Phycisphaerae bacterium]|jgi:3D (Asp-Asp-Asp) domain-containing protein
MYVFRRSTLWLGCAVLTVCYVVADAALSPPARPAEIGVVAEVPDLLTADEADEPLVIEAATLHEPVELVEPVEPAEAEEEGPIHVTLPPRRVRRVQRVTAYCDRGLTAAGVPSGYGQCAAPADIPFGSKVYIPALGKTFIVTDRTHKRFRHNTVDIFMPSSWSCRQFGRKYLECEYTLVREEPDYGDVKVN